MNEPTKEQLKELWEWLGFTHPTSIRGVKDPSGWWLYPENPTYAQFDAPKINLNNLFKYAVPKLKVVTLTNGFKGWTATINQGEMINGEVKAIGESEDPALALFWAIYKVIRK